MSTPRKPPPRIGPLSDRLREIITHSGLTAYALGRTAGVDAGVIQRFLNRERDLRMATADRLAAALNVRLVEASRPRRGRPAPPPEPLDDQAEPPSPATGN